MVGLTGYFAFYNTERPHQSLGNLTPDVVYRTGCDGGAVILDKFRDAGGELSDPLRSTDCSSPDKERSKATAKANTKAKTNTRAKTKPGQRRPAANEVECTA